MDTNIIIEYLKGNPKIALIVDSHLDTDTVAITSINRYELLQRFHKDQSILSFIEDVEIYNFDKKASEKAASMWHSLKAKGKMMDEIDLLIAAIAASNGETLITMDNDFGNLGSKEIIILTK